MPDGRASRIREVFGEVSERHGRDRDRLLRDRCGEDDELRRAVERLLEHESSVRPEFLRGARDGSDAAAPGTMVGHYRILSAVGAGGCGVVYHARQQRPVERDVALKVIKAGMDTREVVARFKAERQALAMMDHPNIARMYDAGETDRGRPYFVMEFVPGTPITQFCDTERLDVTQRLGLFLQVCGAVHHAHGKGIVHRDLKPSNVMVEVMDGYACPKVIDFGIAKSLGRSLTEHTLLTEPGFLVGTPEYMSPEQARLDGRSIGPASDVYSLGVTLYELMAGLPPIDPGRLRHCGPTELQRVIRDWNPPTPSSRLDTIDGAEAEGEGARADRPLDAGTSLREVAAQRGASPKMLRRRLRGDLDAITMKAMAKDAAHRYPTASELAADVRRHLNGEPVLATPTGLGERLGKTLRRHRISVAGTIALIVLTALAAIIAVTSTVTADRERARLARAQDELRRFAYANTIALAQHALDTRETTRLVRLLDECPESLRGWEWRYLARMSDRSVASLPAHRSLVADVAFTPDGRHLVTGSLDETIRIWDGATRTPIRTITGFDGWHMQFALSPDGSRIAASHADHGTFAVWDAETGKMLRQIAAHKERVLPVSFSPDGRLAATGAMNGIVKIWDVATWQEISTLSGHAGPVIALGWARDGRAVFSGSWDRSVLVRDPGTGEVLHRFEHRDRVEHLAVHPDGGWLASSGADNTIRVWDLARGTQAWSVVTGVELAGRLAFTPDGETLVAGVGQAVMTWRWNDARQPPATLLGHFGGAAIGGSPISGGYRVGPVEVSPDGGTIISGAKDGEVKLWSARHLREPARLEGHTGKVRGVAVAPAGDRIVSAAADATIRVWEAATRRPLATLRGHRGEIWDVVITGDGRHLASGGADRTVRIWDADTGAELRSLTGHDGSVQAVAYAPDDRLIASASRDGTARLWEAASGRVVRTLHHGSQVDDVVFTPDGGRVVTSGFDNAVRVWEVVSGAELATFTGSGGDGKLRAVAVSPDGRLVVGGGADTIVWDLDVPDRPGRTLSATWGFVASLAFSPDGERLISGGMSHSVDVWDARSGTLLLSLRGRADAGAVAFAPDGDWLVTGGYDRTVHIWDTVPVIERERERHEALANERLAGPIVTGLIAEGLPPAEIADRLHDDVVLPDGVRRSALRILLRRQAGDVRRLRGRPVTRRAHAQRRVEPAAEPSKASVGPEGRTERSN